MLMERARERMRTAPRMILILKRASLRASLHKTLAQTTPMIIFHQSSNVYGKPKQSWVPIVGQIFPRGELRLPILCKRP